MQLNCLFKARDPSRAVIALSGKGVKEFLQGLYTNDVQAVNADTKEPTFTRGTSLYGCFLSGTGRTLFDGFITDISLRQAPKAAAAAAAADSSSSQKAAAASGGSGLTAPPPSQSALPDEMVLVDVAASVKDLAITHFKDFKLRRKIKINDVSSHVNVYVETIRTAPPPSAFIKSAKGAAAGNAAAATAQLNAKQAVIDEDLVACDHSWDTPLMMLDPRHGIAVEGSLGDFSEVPEALSPAEVEGAEEPALPPPLGMVLRRGYKFLSAAEIAEQEAADLEALTKDAEGLSGNVFDNATSNSANLRSYRAIVESLCGIPSGSRTFLPNKGLPFEGNIDQLWSVSFEKGCYLGQELTHRTHVMLVCRKRVVPILLGHFDSREEIISVVDGLGATSSSSSSSRLKFSAEDLTLSGVDFSIPKTKVWGDALKHDVEYIVKSNADTNAAPSEEATGATAAGTKQKPANAALAAQGHKIYVDASSSSSTGSGSSSSAPDPKALTLVGHVTNGQYNLGAGLLRLRYMNKETRTMKVYIKRVVDPCEAEGGGCSTCYASRVPEYVPATAFIPLWWADEVVEKVLTAAEADE